MPKDKDLKRIVRSRMQKTGESYTAARARILARKPPAGKSPADEPPAEEPTAAGRPGAAGAKREEYATRAGMEDDTVRDRTGRGWAEWVEALDAVDAASWPHRDIAAHLADEHGLSGWWAQSVTVGYERIRGLRDIGQRRGGAYEISKSKTVPVPIEALYRAFDDPSTRERWLPGVDLTVRTATANKSMRVTWPDETSVEVYFIAKGKEKSQVAVQHTKLASREDGDARRKFWGERLARLAELLAP